MGSMKERNIKGMQRTPRGAHWVSGAQVRGFVLLAFAVIAWLGSRNASAAPGPASSELRRAAKFDISTLVVVLPKAGGSIRYTR